MQTEQHAISEIEIKDCWNTNGVWSRTDKKCPELERVLHCRNCPVYSSTGRSLLDRSISSDYQDEWTALLSEEKQKVTTGTKSAFAFRCGKEWLAIPAKMVREVVDMGIIHTIPHMSNNTLRGLVNIKGKLEVCVSIGTVLGIERDEQDKNKKGYMAPERLIVVNYEGQVITFPVTEIYGVVRYQPEMLRDLPVTVSGSKAAYTKGILCRNNKDIGLLRIRPLLHSLTKDLL